MINLKDPIKHATSRLGMFAYLDFVRRTPEICEWINRGCPAPPPAPIKRKVILSYLKRFQIENFVETGTHMGDTLAEVAFNSKILCFSIELADQSFYKAKKRFADYKNVELHHGDSARMIIPIIERLTSPALFWLDGHYSGGETAHGAKATPVSEELTAILNAPQQGHVILIDDMHCFNGCDDYPYLDELLHAVREHGGYDAEVGTNICRITPKPMSTI
jgi:hypothetical protein